MQVCTCECMRSAGRFFRVFQHCHHACDMQCSCARIHALTCAQNQAVWVELHSSKLVRRVVRDNLPQALCLLDVIEAPRGVCTAGDKVLLRGVHRHAHNLVGVVLQYRCT
eukprot:366462-Chlamydomonas_euryale.AAC.14